MVKRIEGAFPLLDFASERRNDSLFRSKERPTESAEINSYSP